jgi:hypothetical protein
VVRPSIGRQEVKMNHLEAGINKMKKKKELIIGFKFKNG